VIKLKNQKLDFIQSLRGIAALSVVLWHASRYLAPYGTGLSGAIFSPGGAGGVDLFFIISGFILVYTTKNNDGSFKSTYNFLIKRFTRIWPLWIIALFVYTFLVQHQYDCLWEPKKINWLIHSLFFVPRSDQLGSIPPLFDLPILGVGWFLNYQIYLYLIFGCCLLFGRWRWLAFFLWIAVTLLIVPLAMGYIYTWSMLLSPYTKSRFVYDYIKMATNPIIWLFVAGVLIGFVYNSQATIRNMFYARILLFGTISLAIWQFASHFRIHHGILYWGLTLVPLVFSLSLTSKTIKLVQPSWLVYMGDISFSLYLFHPTVQEGFDQIVRLLGLDFLAAGYSAMFITTVFTVILSALTHRYLEKKLTSYLRKKMLLSQKT
jgi:exopolysaccharide production protein ExoZ